tara:strand:- start:2275 stop:4701 length:2427 start_codon:yes stop_codon:yes gene_type:complete
MVLPKMAVFDIDETLTDPSKRVRAARRAGYLAGEEYGGKQSYPKGMNAFIEWFDSPERFRSDTPLPGAVQYVNSLVSQGYIIAYLTARREIRKDATVEHLKSMGFPIFDSNTREPLVYLKKSKKKSTPKYKYETMRDLQRYYDIHYFFDDQQKNRDVAFQLGVIGVYDLRDRLGIRNNPTGYGPEWYVGSSYDLSPEDTPDRTIYMPSEEALARQYAKRQAQKAPKKSVKMIDCMRCGKPTFEDTLVEDSFCQKCARELAKQNPSHLNCGCGKTPCVTYGSKPNPNDELQRTIDAIKGLIESRELRLTQADKMLRAYGPNEELEAKYWAIDKDRRALLNLQYEFFNAKDDPVETARLKQKLNEIVARSNPNTEVPEGYREAAGCLVQRKSDGKILFLRRSPKETSKHGLYEFPGGKLESGETARDTALIETLEEAGLEVNIIRQLDSHVDHTMRKVYHCFVAAPKKGAKVKLSEEHDMYKWCSLSKKWPKDKLSHHARFMLNQLKEGALPNPLPRPKKKGNRKEPAKAYVKRMMGNTKMRAEFPDRSQRYAVTINLVEKHYGKRGLKSIGAKPNPKTKVLPILSGEPSGKHTKLGAVFAEVVIGRNIVKDVGEVVQGIYRGLIGGRTSMAEKRMAMGVASMQKELSDRTQELGGNAVCNLKIDYEMIQGSQTITIIATADAIKMARPPTRKNPRMPLDGMEDDKKVKKAKKKYKKFHGGKEPENVEKATIDVGEVWYSLGPCWSIGYMSPKETGDDEQKYIHHTNEDSKDGNYPMMYATMPESGEPMIIIKGGSMKIGMRDGLAWLID